MRNTATILASIRQDGWIDTELDRSPALGFRTERLTAYLTNAAGTGLPSTTTDWRITWIDAEGEQGPNSATHKNPWENVDDAITYLPAYNLVCRHCGSDDVTADAVARWDPDTATWDLSSTFDDRNCGSCNAEGDSILKAVLPLPNLMAPHVA